MEKKKRLEPGCFGISVCYEPESQACRSCKFKAACRDKGKAEALLIHKEISALELLAHFDEVRSVSPRSLAKKPQELVTSLVMSRIDIGSMVDRGIDPFRGKTRNAHLSVVCQLLMEGGFTREQLIAGFRGRFDWSYQTASSYASVAITALKALNVITGDKRFVRKK